MTPYNIRRMIGYLALGLTVVIILAACAAPFDAKEHGGVATIHQLALNGRAACDNPDTARAMAHEMARQSQWVYIYASSLDGNREMARMAKELMDITQDFHTRYQQPTAPSKIYCQAKVDNVNKATDIMLKVSGRRTR